jgi:hypothetical protein
MIADVREKLRVDESLASVDEEVDANVDVEIDVDVAFAVAVEKVRILEKRESMRAVEKRREGGREGGRLYGFSGS